MDTDQETAPSSSVMACALRRYAHAWGAGVCVRCGCDTARGEWCGEVVVVMGEAQLVRVDSRELQISTW